MAEYIDHRWGTRLQSGVSTDLWTPDGEHPTVIIRDVSLSGVFVETPLRYPLLTNLSVRSLATPGQWLRGIVVRSNDDGMGLEWLDPDVSAIAALRPAKAPHDATRVPAERPRSGTKA